MKSRYNPSTMQMLALVVKIVGAAAYLLGWFPALREMFAENRGLGYAGFGVPIIPLVFALIHWEDLKVPAIFMMSGGLVLVGGIALERFV